MLPSTQISTIILKVDLDCHKCYKKLRKILCCLQDQERIRTISYDNKSGTIAIVGPFDPHRLSCKIRCKGGKVIKDILILDGAGGKPPRIPEQPPPCNGKQKPKEKPRKEMPPLTSEPPPQQPPAPETPSPPAAQPAPVVSAQVPPMKEMDVPMDRPVAELEPMPNDKPIHKPVLPPERPPERPVVCWKPNPPPTDMTPTMVEIPSWPAPPLVGPCGCSSCTPCYQGYYDGCRCCHCSATVYGYGYAAGTGTGTPYCAGYRGCRIVNEEDPTACTIM